VASRSWEATAGEKGEKSGMCGDFGCLTGDIGGVTEYA